MPTSFRKDTIMICSWPEIQKLLPLDFHVLLYGPPGTGKTFSATDGKCCYSLTLTAETPAAELRGHYIPKGQEFVWQDGPAITAWREGATLVLNEIDQASGDALTFLHAILDDPHMAQLTLPSGETVTPTQGFRAIATMNGAPIDLPAALLDRFSVRLFVDEPPEDALEGLQLASAVRETLKVDDLERRVSLRQAKAFEFVAASLGHDLASKAVFGTRGVDILNALKLSK